MTHDSGDSLTNIPDPEPETKPEKLTRAVRGEYAKPDGMDQEDWDKMDEGTRSGVSWSHQSAEYKKDNPFGSKDVE